MALDVPDSDLERRKQIKLRLRPDLDIAAHKYEGKTFYIVKDPVSLRYYRFKEQEHFLLRLMDGKHTLDDAQQEFEDRYRPDRLKLEDLESFGQQLLTVGLAHNESPQAGKQLFDRRKKRLRREWLGTLTNILYIKIPVFDPDRLLTKMLPWLGWIFTPWNALFSIGLMFAAISLVLTHFEQFRDKLPAYHQFFSMTTVGYLWLALGVVKVIHEFGHGLSCKYFGGEVHEMGFLFLCLSPCLYCNVTDSWTLPSKWQRIIISFAGIYVELIIAAIATFVWWNSPTHPFVNNLSLSVMLICSVNTVVFNGNPLMRFDGYYMLADWLEIPNLRDRCNKYLKNLALREFLGVEVPREQYMALQRRILFLTYATVSWLYRWMVTFSILYFLSMFLKPYKLGAVSSLLTVTAAASMVGWPLYRMGEGLHKRGRLPDMKPIRVRLSILALMIILAVFFFVPLPVSRIREVALVEVQPQYLEKVFVPNPGGVLTSLDVRPGETVVKGASILARFRNPDLVTQLEEAQSQMDAAGAQIEVLQKDLGRAGNEESRGRMEREIARLRGDKETNTRRVETLNRLLTELSLKAPRDGVVMGLPQVDEIGRYMDAEQSSRAFCSIGDPTHLRVLVPLSPADYRLLLQDLAAVRGEQRDLAVTIRVKGRGERTWQGVIAQLPEAEAKEIPPALTSKFGGPLAFKPPSGPNESYAPLSQVYLVGIDIKDSDGAIAPGTLSQVKIHCRWQTARWWVWRSISQAFDLGLM